MRPGVCSTQLLILFGVECFLVFRILALTCLRYLCEGPVIGLGAGQVRPRVHDRRGASRRQDWGVYGRGGAGVHHAVVKDPRKDREDRLNQETGFMRKIFSLEKTRNKQMQQFISVHLFSRVSSEVLSQHVVLLPIKWRVFLTCLISKLLSRITKVHLQCTYKSPNAKLTHN